ncbi:MAG: DNA mismatch repair protein MutS [Clostridiales bacterium]|jgi:DNA mismatch repair protein MutS|nr:DNA mismatch repair protein MutS [Clostridiales bacterium]
MAGNNITPLMRQYLALKEKYQDCLLLFRLGDFYEMFFEDAITASRELEIVLTGKDCGLEERAPMCGVPYHSVNTYIRRLIEKGYKVALCEQLSDSTPGQGLVERDVVRVITPGTVIEETMLDENANNYLLSIYLEGEDAGLAYADVSTGGSFVGELHGDLTFSQLMDELARIQPTEIIANDALFLQSGLVKRLSGSCCFLQNYAHWAYEEQAALRRLLRHFDVASLDGFGCSDMHYAICAAGALMAYLEETQKNALSHIHSMRFIRQTDYLMMDAATRRNLELTKPLHFEGSKKNTLLNLLDETQTAMGGRMLKTFIEQPLQDIGRINDRLEAVEDLGTNIIQRDALREALSSIYDIERLCSRIAYGTVNARDCAALRASLWKLPVIIDITKGFQAASLLKIADATDPLEDIKDLLARAIVDEPPLSIQAGNIIRKGYNAQVDALNDAKTNGQQWIADLETSEREATGIKNLRVSYNKVFGYYIEVTKSYQNLVPYHYQRRQTLANAERYITPALKEIEESILGAQEKCETLEAQLFGEIREILGGAIARLQDTAARMAELDVYQSLSRVASEKGYVRPAITNDGVIDIKNGRHPVVERANKGQFIQNDSYLDNENNRLIILTGPNMAGKSTYIRQVALITLMAHIGSFVPADQASICMTDRIFTRVGASDSLAAGQSTFMVEMSEMANILHNSTAHSLLLLDEIGRGTSTFDGLSIAWAVLEHIADPTLCGAKTLFATHYHELTELEGKLSGVKNYRITVKEMGDDIIFLRKIMRGSADKSFGVQVAKLAGLPESVLKRARELLHALEQADINKTASRHLGLDKGEPHLQLSLFNKGQKEALLMELSKLDIDALSPIQALNTLNDMHQRAKAIGLG